MKAVWLGFALIACSHHDEPKPAPAGSGSAACDDADLDVIHAKKTRYAKDGIVAFRHALDEAGLTPYKLPHKEITVDAKTDHPPQLGSTITTSEGTFLVGPTFSTTDELPPEGLDIAADPNHKLYVVQRMPNLIPDPYRACECVYKPCPKPGTPETHRLLYGPIPPDVTLAGSRPIAFPEHRLEPNYVDPNKICACPRP